MSRNILCAVYLLIAISAVHSASYYYRAGREVIVPTIEEVKEVISELKKDEGVIVEEIVAAVPAEPIVEPIVKTVPIAENIVPVVEVVENNVVADAAEKVVVSEAVGDEARSKPNPVLRLDTLEVIQPSGEKSEKVITVAETVKNAAVQAIEKQNQEVAESVKVEEPVVPEIKVVETPVVKSVPVVEPVVVQPVVEPAVVQTVVEPVVPLVVENVDASVKSVESVPVVKVVESVVPAVEAEKVVVVKESVRSADPEPAKPEEPAKEEKIEVQQPTEKTVVAPEIRQTPGPLDQIQNVLNSFTSNIQNAIQNIGANFNINSSNRPPQQSDSGSPASELNTAEQAPAADATQAAAPVTTAPNLLQSVQQAITQFTNNIIPAQLRPTTAPSAHAEPPVVVSGTRGGDETVEVVQNIDVDVNDKVDLSKKTQ